MPVEPKVIYLEADEEITSAVDKLRKTEFPKVIFVVPKEAGLLQSVVNLKLLKRQAENLKKEIALVTQDKVGRNLAEKIGLLVAPKLESLKGLEDFGISVIDPEEVQASVDDNSPLADTNEVVFKKDKKPTTTATFGEEEDDEAIVIKEGEDEKPEKLENDEEWQKKEVKEAEPLNLMPKFPIKKALLLGSVVFLVLFSLGFYYLPRARATIMMKAESKPVSLDFKGEKSATLDSEKAIIPIQTIEVTKDSSKKFQATGSKNVGEKASGTLTVLNGSNAAVTLATFSPKGRSELVYIAPSPITVNKGESKTVLVEAQKPGDQYNGFNNGDFYAVKANDDSIIVKAYNGLSGGSSKTVKYITESDFSTAKDNLAKEALDEATSDFNKKAEELKVIEDSKKKETVSATASPNVDTEVDEFTVSVKVSIKALAFNVNDVSELVKAEVTRQLGFAKQIIDDGAKDADIAVSSSDLSAGTASGTIKTTAYVSSKLEEDKIKTELAGLNSTKATNYLTGLEGVEDTKLEFWPPFIKLFPRLKSHIYVTVQVSDASRGN